MTDLDEVTEDSLKTFVIATDESACTKEINFSTESGDQDLNLDAHYPMLKVGPSSSSIDLNEDQNRLGNEANSASLGIHRSALHRQGIIDSTVTRSLSGQDQQGGLFSTRPHVNVREILEMEIETLLSSKPDVLHLLPVRPSGSGLEREKGYGKLPECQTFEDQYRAVLHKNLSTLGEESVSNKEHDDYCDTLVGGTESSSEESAEQTQRRRGLCTFSRYKSIRLKQMRRKLTFSSLDKVSAEDICVKRAISLDGHLRRKGVELNHFGKRYLHESSNGASAAPALYDVASGSTTITEMIERLACDCGSVENVVPSDDYVVRGGLKSLLENEEDLVYDSDPEFPHMNRASLSDEFEGIEEEEENYPEDDSESDKYDEQYHHGLNEFTDYDKLNTTNSDLSALQLLQEMTNGSISLIWHPPRHGCGNKNPIPTCVKAWIELGCRLRGSLIQPKLVWRSAYEEVGCTVSDSRLNCRHILSTPEYLGAIELLDIARVLSLNAIEREENPLAAPSKTFTIMTSEKDSLIFEATDKIERDRLVSALKLLVARLASMVIVGDRSLFLDFFHPLNGENYDRQNWLIQRAGGPVV